MRIRFPNAHPQIRMHPWHHYQEQYSAHASSCKNPLAQYLPLGGMEALNERILGGGGVLNEHSLREMVHTTHCTIHITGRRYIHIVDADHGSKAAPPNPPHCTPSPIIVVGC